MGQLYQLKKLANEIIRFSNDLESGKVANDIASKCAALIQKDLNKIFKTSIDLYYEYPKKYYKRTKSFYKTYRITASGTSISAIANSDLMPKTHRVDAKDSDYIYNYMFAQGFHGGAASGKPDSAGNPFPGPMALRTPVPEFASQNIPAYSLWSKHEAGQTEAPETIINNNLDAYQGGAENFSGSTLEQRFNTALEKTLRGYSIFK